ncbi:DUF4340 domain-containing protein [Pseudobutyrivibrio xylanivorans]|nr:DUF4340 domain-containing protein [Pseudobutyrivibrio xylanivorans]
MSDLIQSKYFKIGLLCLVVILLALLIFFSLGKGDKVFLGVSSEEQTYADALDKESEEKDEGEEVFMIPKEDVYSFLITDSNGIRLTFENQDDNWICTDNTDIDIDENRVDKLLNYLCDVRCVNSYSDVDGSVYGLDQTSKEYRVTDSAGGTIIISIGNIDEESGGVYFSINYDFSTVYLNSGKLAKASEYAIQDLVQLNSAK